MKGIIDWFSGRASIRKKLIISFSIMVSVPVLILGFYSFYKTKVNMESQTEAVVENNLTRLASEMETRVSREVDNSKYLAYNVEFRKALETARENTMELAAVLNRNVEPVFWYFVTSDEYMKALFVYTPVLERNMGSFVKTSKGVESLDWYQEHQKNFQATWELEKERLYCTRSILDTDSSSQTMGVMRMEFFLSTFLEPLNTMEYLNNGVLLVNEAGQILYEKNPDKELGGLALLARLKSDEKTERVYLQRSERLENCDWTLYYFIPRKEIAGQLYEIWRGVFFIVAACLAVIVVLITVFSKGLSRRILLLKEKAEEVAEGNFENPIFTKDSDEIGVVTNSMANMTVRLKEMVHQVYVMKIEKQEMELKTLRAMINPHFLYNSFSSVKWLAIRQGNDQISDLIGYMARFYRTCLNNGEELTTVGNELENIRSYIEIQRVTHEDSFVSLFLEEEEAMGERMINFILQPIVENAIKHGIDYCQEQEREGTLLVESAIEEDFLVFRIYNNGPAMTEEELNQSLSEQGKGYGLYNIKQRISLYYGERAEIKAWALPLGGVCFMVKIPKIVQDF